MKKRALSIFVILLMLVPILSSCTTTAGSYTNKSHFVYPNSNVEPLGNTKATITKSSFAIPPSLSRKDVENVIDKAISKRSGADILLDYKTNTSISNYGLGPLMYYKLEIAVEGTAAEMAVGKQDLDGNR